MNELITIGIIINACLFGLAMKGYYFECRLKKHLFGEHYEKPKDVIITAIFAMIPGINVRIIYLTREVEYTFRQAARAKQKLRQAIKEQPLARKLIFNLEDHYGPHPERIQSGNFAAQLKVVAALHGYSTLDMIEKRGNKGVYHTVKFEMQRKGIHFDPTADTTEKRRFARFVAYGG